MHPDGTEPHRRQSTKVVFVRMCEQHLVDSERTVRATHAQRRVDQHRTIPTRHHHRVTVGVLAGLGTEQHGDV